MNWKRIETPVQSAERASFPAAEGEFNMKIHADEQVIITTWAHYIKRMPVEYTQEQRRGGQVIGLEMKRD